MFERVLVANRGEIAVRVMRTLRDLGISPAAIHSEVDRDALHVRSADTSICVGPEASSESYLNQEAVIGAAVRSGAQAIHPGYGFLSENAEFAERVQAAGLVWIGPPAAAIRSMGDKLLARQTVAAAGVPLVPGTGQVDDPAAALQAARGIGFPVMIKASAGGGGKGMRLVSEPERFGAAFLAARREAAGAFGDDSVYVEKFVVGPHHVEIQVLADTHGQVVWVGERECSVQRRHQKVIEECPSPFIDGALRERMGQVAVAATRAAGYVGAGTVEFLVGADRGFYFLEMNTRLQVEHPVTEAVYGVDLVAAQLAIAAGHPLPWAQEELRPRGHAVECRIYAEDPLTFLPCPGAITGLEWPRGPGVRVDEGVDGRSEVPMAYDPMIAKVVTWGADRAEAIRRMGRALDDTVVLGITSNVALHRRVLRHDGFRAGRYDTSLLDGSLPAEDPPPEGWQAALAVAAALHRLRADEIRAAEGPAAHQAGLSAWRRRALPGR